MDSIRYRKNLQYSELNKQQENDEDLIDDKDHSKSIQSPEFKYSQILLLSFLPPLAILLAFGGKPSLITIGFGSIIAYILDLLGTIEGTYSLIVVTIIAFWGTLVWSGKLLLLESWINVSILLIFGYFLFFFLIILASQFRSLRYEFDQSLYYYEYFLFAATPLIASTIITWFLCLEFSAFQLPYCFSIVYFGYMLILAQPRKTSYPLPMKFSNNLNHQHECYILKLSIIKIMYIIPIIISFCLTISIQHNNIFFLTWTSLTNITISILIPSLFMIICSAQQLEYWPIQQRHDISMSISTLKLGIVAILFACLQDHEIFDDLKSFSEMSDTLSSATFCGIVMLATLAVGIYHSETVPLSIHTIPDGDVYTITNAGKNNNSFSNNNSNSSSAIIDSRSSSSSTIINSSTTTIINNYNPHTALVKRILVDSCTGGAGLLCGLLLRSPLSVLPFTILGSVAIAEYYQDILHHDSRSNLNVMSRSNLREFIKENQLFKLTVALLASVCAAITMLGYGDETIHFDAFTFTFEAYGYSMKLDDFCLFSVLMTVMAVMVPMVMYSTKMTVLSSSFTSITDDDDDDVDVNNGYLLPISSISTNNYTSTSSSITTRINTIINEMKTHLKYIKSGKWMSTNKAFSVLFPSCCMVLSVVELLVREQDWTNHFTTAMLVYPYPLFISTSLLISFTAIHLYQQRAIKSWCLWTILIVQGMKLTSLNGVKLTDIFAMGAIFLSYSRPFLVHCLDQEEKDSISHYSNSSGGSNSSSSNSSVSNNNGTSNSTTNAYTTEINPPTPSSSSSSYLSSSSSSSLNWPLFLMYIGNAAFATNFARNILAGRFLLYLTARESGDFQHITASLCIFCAFTTAMLHTFRRKLKTLRSLFIASTILSALLTSDTITLPFRATSSFPYLVFDSTAMTGTASVAADIYEYHHESSYVGLFAVISLLLSLSATTSILSIKKPIARLGYCLFFSFCASRAMRGWAFPAHEGGNKNGLSFSNIFCFLFTFICTATVLHASSSSSSSSNTNSYSKKSIHTNTTATEGTSMHLFILSILTPILFLSYALLIIGLEQIRIQNLHTGLLWSAAVAYGCISLAIRIATVSSHIKKMNSSKKNDSSNNSNSHSSSNSSSSNSHSSSNSGSSSGGNSKQVSMTATATTLFYELSSSVSMTSSSTTNNNNSNSNSSTNRYLSSKDDMSITTIDTICFMSASLGIFWTIIVTQLTHSSSSSSSSIISIFLQDLVIPLSTLYLLACRYGTIRKNTHSLSISLLLCSCWWLLCGLYSILLQFEDDDNIHPFDTTTGSSSTSTTSHHHNHHHHQYNNGNFLFVDGNVSIWSSPSLFMPLLHFALLIAPLPSIVLSFLKIKEQSEEVIFMLAVISFASVLGSQLASIRLLGIAGVMSGFYRSSDISERKRKGHRLI